MHEWQMAVHAAWGGMSPWREMLVGAGCLVSVHAIVKCRYAFDQWKWRRLLKRAAREDQFS